MRSVVCTLSVSMIFAVTSCDQTRLVPHEELILPQYMVEQLMANAQHLQRKHVPLTSHLKSFLNESMSKEEELEAKISVENAQIIGNNESNDRFYANAATVFSTLALAASAISYLN